MERPFEGFAVWAETAGDHEIPGFRCMSFPRRTPTSVDWSFLVPEGDAEAMLQDNSGEFLVPVKEAEGGSAHWIRSPCVAQAALETSGAVWSPSCVIVDVATKQSHSYGHVRPTRSG